MSLSFSPTALPGVLVVTSVAAEDGAEPVFAAEAAGRAGVPGGWTGAELWRLTERGALRGLHLDPGPVLVRCVQGEVWAVAVDLRPDSPTCRRWVGMTLSLGNGHGLVVPAGCASGFVALAAPAAVLRLASAEGRRRGLRWDDPRLGIAWPVAAVSVPAAEQAYPGVAAPG